MPLSFCNYSSNPDVAYENRDPHLQPFIEGKSEAFTTSGIFNSMHEQTSSASLTPALKAKLTSMRRNFIKAINEHKESVPSPLNSLKIELNATRRELRDFSDLGFLWEIKRCKETIAAINKDIAELESTFECAFATQNNFEEIDYCEKSIPTLTFQYSAKEAQGRRPTMEDEYFYREIDEGIILGLLDGHGGKEVATYSQRRISHLLPIKLKACGSDVHRAFTETIDEVHKEIEMRLEWDTMGSTLVMSFIDHKTNLIYTATLGDSEANIYRVINGKMKSIPLSCIRDWDSASDMARFLKARNPELLQDRKTLKQDTLLLQTESKKIWGHLTGKGRRSGYTTENMGLNQIIERCSITGVGVNVSRALGDVYYGEVMSHKSKITVTQVQPGDIIILACDGLKDYVLEDHIIELVLKNKKANKLASALVQCALDEYHSTDNIMVLVVNVN